MLVEMTLDEASGFQIKLDDQIAFKVSSLPESFVFQTPTGDTFFVKRVPLGFLSQRKYTVCNAQRIEIAQIRIKIFGFGSELVVDGIVFAVKMTWKPLVVFGFKPWTQSVRCFGIEIDAHTDWSSYEASTTYSGNESVQLAIVVLLQFAHIFQMRTAQSGS